MDGVLIDSEPVYTREAYEFLKKQKVEVDYKDLYPLVGTSSEHFWQALADRWPHPITTDEVKRRFAAESKPFNYRTVLFPHVSYALKWCREKGLKIGLASSSPMDNIRQVLFDCGISSCFDVVVSGEDFPKSKPDPAVYLAALERLSLRPEEGIAVEDSQVGITAAKRAGLFVAAREERRFGFDQLKADSIVCDLLELLDLIEGKVTGC